MKTGTHLIGGHTFAIDAATGTSFEFHPCRNCGRAPTVRQKSNGTWFCCCVNGKCEKRPSATVETLQGCWEMWERL